MKKYIIAVVLLSWCIGTNSIAAQTTTELELARDKSLSYLIQNQNGDGSWGKTQDEKVRITATVLDTFRKYYVSGLVYRRAINWLSNAEATSADSLARQAYALAKAGIPIDTDHFLTDGIATGTTTLWGPLNEFRYTTVDSSLVLRALTAASSDFNVDDALSYLKGRRNTAAVTDPDGSGWSFSNSKYNTKDISKVLPTAQMLLFLHELGGTHWGQTADKNAAQWLALQQQTGGAISDNDLLADIETFLAVQVLGVAKDVTGAAAEVLPAYGDGLDYILSRQNDAGDIGNDLYKTALALQAMFSQDQSLIDTDSDGIPDSVEVKIGTDPQVIDTDYLESGNGNNFDASSGGNFLTELIVNESVDVQIDTVSGGLLTVSGVVPTGMEVNYTSNTLIGTPTTVSTYSLSYQITKSDGTLHFGTLSIRVVDSDSDTDKDGIPVSFETDYPSILNSLNGNDADSDGDGDGLTNYMEFIFSTNPTLIDSDGDGINDLEELSISDSDSDNMPDYFEISNGLNPFIDDASEDLDNDGLTNYEEYQLGLSPNNPDTDHDGKIDGEDPYPIFNSGTLVPMLHLLLFEDANEQQAASMNESSQIVPLQEFEEF